MSDLKFNVNSVVRVKLADLGLDLLRKEHEELRAAAPSLGEWSPPVDADGYSRFQLWDLMARFGEHMGNGSPLMFETDIMIPSHVTTRT